MFFDIVKWSYEMKVYQIGFCCPEHLRDEFSDLDGADYYDIRMSTKTVYRSLDAANDALCKELDGFIETLGDERAMDDLFETLDERCWITDPERILKEHDDTQAVAVLEFNPPEIYEMWPWIGVVFEMEVME